MAGMMLADMGATVIRVERNGDTGVQPKETVSLRGKKSLALNLKNPRGVETLLRLVEKADVLIDPYRPGVCEKLGIGPDVCLARNPRLIFGRMTGWGQTGPLAHVAGHDINYLAVTGALYAIGRNNERPAVPLNLIGDMGGGGMLLVNGVLAALLETTRSGKGQVIDVAMVDGVAQLMWMVHGLHAIGHWDANRRGVNLVDGGAHYYNIYQCADGEYITVASIEPQFYALLMELVELPREDFGNQNNQSQWPVMEAKLADIFKQKTQAEWCERLEGTDVCFAPVLTFKDAPTHPANRARQTYIEVDGITQPAPAPRFGRTPSQVAHGAHALGEDTDEVLRTIGFTEQDIAGLRDNGAVG